MDHEYDQDRKHARAAHPGHHDAVEPGQSSRSQLLRRPEQPIASGLVQRKAGAGDDEAAVHAAASRGVATTSSQLPYLDTIQPAFGRHDISGVQAHIGPEAIASARAMGAQAYATGNHVVLGEGADLPTVAHEAAHVVQQRGGVQLNGGVGQQGDAYEQHADAVADKVVQGTSAESLLDQYASRSQADGLPVQRKAVQMLNIAIDDSSNKVTSVSQRGDPRVGGSQRRGEGDHTTAYATFKDMVRNQVIGKTVPEAAKALEDTLQEISAMPGMQIQTADKEILPFIKQVLPKLQMIQNQQISKSNIKKELEGVMKKIIEIRNSVPLSSVIVTNSSGGNGEASNRSTLTACEDHLRRQEWVKYTPDLLCQFIWGLFDYNPINSTQNVVIANTILQHITSMRITYPRVWDHLTDKGSAYFLHNYFKHYMITSNRFLKINDKSRLQLIMEKVSDAVMGGYSAIKMGASTEYDKQFGNPLPATGL